MADETASLGRFLDNDSDLLFGSCNEVVKAAYLCSYLMNIEIDYQSDLLLRDCMDAVEQGQSVKGKICTKHGKIKESDNMTVPLFLEEWHTGIKGSAHRDPRSRIKDFPECW